VHKLPASRLTREQWLEIAKFPTQRAAVEATGYDPKTLHKHFTLHDIPNPWRKRPSR
jgi:hypothetical protein